MSNGGESYTFYIENEGKLGILARPITETRFGKIIDRTPLGRRLRSSDNYDAIIRENGEIEKEFIGSGQNRYVLVRGDNYGGFNSQQEDSLAKLLTEAVAAGERNGTPIRKQTRRNAITHRDFDGGSERLVPPAKLIAQMDYRGLTRIVDEEAA